ncbi:metalloregulator ArsR/SmtB family transcription factor [Candidatus Sororendozoicomonas aggregata]|uniref:ArsR/SmtB family transcription factor n=1 Tax=Candidatus Sororendozoicomonas aggregata TaxID=3073239 RepID=UPI002ED5B879
MPEITTTDQLATFGKAFGDKLRLSVLRVLRTESLGVLALSEVFGMRQPAMSHHLKVLLQAGLVTTRKEGNTIFYRRALPPANSCHEGIIRAFFTAVDRTGLSEELTKRLNSIQQQRAEQSRQFFVRNADVLSKQQELIADHGLYAEGMTILLGQTSFPASALAVEIGPGEGAFLKTLSQQFARVYAVDNCQTMLRCSQQRANDEKLDNVKFHLGEIHELDNLNNQCDCIVANMVLHHVPSPAAMIPRALALLKPGGSFLVSELCRHDQEWTRSSCGDLWLGFSPEELSQWAEQAGFINCDAQYLALRNGFQIQVRRFTRPA